MANAKPEPPRLTAATAIEKIADQLRQSRTPRIAAPENELVEDLDLPLSTYHAEKRAGRGPRVFQIGRRNYVLLTDWKDWLNKRASDQNDAPVAM